MFTDSQKKPKRLWLYGKKSPKSQTFLADEDKQQTQPADINSPAQDEFLLGLELEVFSKNHNLSKDQIWQKIRAGELIGRTQKGKLYIYESTTSKLESNEDDFYVPPPNKKLATLEKVEKTLGKKSEAIENTLSVQQSSTEVALLIDHLSLAKEENKEILSLTQQSIEKITTMADRVVSVKNEQLAEKDLRLKEKEDQIKALKEVIELREQQLLKLQQEKEDLETLANTLSSYSSNL